MLYYYGTGRVQAYTYVKSGGFGFSKINQHRTRFGLATYVGGSGLDFPTLPKIPLVAFPIYVGMKFYKTCFAASPDGST